MAGECVDVEQAHEADEEHDHEHQCGQGDDQTKGDGPTGKDDGAQHLVVHEVEHVIDTREEAIDEIGIGCGALSHARQTTGGL